MQGQVLQSGASHHEILRIYSTTLAFIQDLRSIYLRPLEMYMQTNTVFHEQSCLYLGTSSKVFYFFFV